MKRPLGILTVVAALTVGLASTPARSALPTTVTNVNDSGAGSLRDAIDNANSNPGPDLIDFNIAGGGVHTITPASVLPDLTDTVTIDGYTQPGSSKNSVASGSDAVLTIDIDGSSLASGNILQFDTGSAGSAVRGLVLNNLASTGQAIRFSANTDSGFAVSGCFIGTNAAGTLAAPNPEGIDATSGNTITIGGTDPGARNIIAGNSGNGIRFVGSTPSNNTIVGNLIGLDKNGGPLTNGGDAVAITGGSVGNLVIDNKILSAATAGSLGIDLDNDGVTANDRKDPDTGSNNLQNYPVLSFATLNTDGSTTITGKLNSRPKKLFTIQFFANSGEPDGEIPLGQLNVKTNKFGKTSFTFITTRLTSSGETVTATATNFSTSDTSEFSAPVPVAVG